MKATKFFLVSVFALLFFVGHDLKSGDCVNPIDGLSDLVGVQIDVSPWSHIIGTCTTTVLVEFCCQVNPTTGNLEIDLKGIHITNIGCWGAIDFSAKEFYDEIFKQMIETVATLNFLYCPLDAGSCDDPPATFLVAKRATCWALVNRELNQGMGDWIIALEACEEVEGKCFSEYSICYDYLEEKYNITLISETSSYSTGCFGTDLIFDPDPSFGTWNGQVFEGEVFMPCTPTCD